MQRRGAVGNTTASRVKALLLHVQEAYGRAEADAFLLKTRFDRDYLEDETRRVPIELWHNALVAFASRFGRSEIPRTLGSIVHPENLGVWTRVLRGAGSPRLAFRQLDQHGGDDVLTERWIPSFEGPGHWRAQVPIASPEFERDGLCALARASELAALPLLFGLSPGEARLVSASGAGPQEFEVRWTEPTRRPLLAGGAIGGAAGALSALAAGMTPEAAVALGLGTSLVGCAGGALVAHDRRRRVGTRAQLVRIQALERAATLRDARERGAETFQQGAVVAGQYRLGQQLGAGASGAIWEATRLSDGQVVAIKLLRAAVAHDTVAADRLRREAAALGLTWHSNVVEIYDDGHLPDGTSFLVMERLHGESLAERLRRDGTLPVQELLHIALQVCDALGAVHAAGVVHRDLKPSNIFLSEMEPASDASVQPSGRQPASAPHVKLLDFGVARVEWAETRITNAGAPLGTPGYMSPEQEQGLEIDPRSDLFSFGALLYECLSGQPPPLRSYELWAHHFDADFESGVQRAMRAIPEPWRRVIERAMAQLPRDRYADARAMREALAALEEPAASAVSSSASP